MQLLLEDIFLEYVNLYLSGLKKLNLLPNVIIISKEVYKLLY